jgi:Fe-S-cluster containining protein
MIDLQKWNGQELHSFHTRGVVFEIPRSTDGYFLLHRCSECGGCCRPPLLKRIMLTYADMIRLSQHFGYSSIDEFRAKECVKVEFKFLAGAPLKESTASGLCLKMNSEERSEDSVSGRPLRCRFLNENNSCSIYSVRPSPCRIWPYEVRFRPNPNKPSGMDITALYLSQKDVECKGFIEKRTIKRWLLREPALETSRYIMEMQETINRGLYEQTMVKFTTPAP